MGDVQGSILLDHHITLPAQRNHVVHGYHLQTRFERKKYDPLEGSALYRLIPFYKNGHNDQRYIF